VKEVRAKVNEIREAKFPSLSKIGTAGSFFKNPIIGKVLQNEIEGWLDAPIPFHEVDENYVKIPLAWILEKLGWKGKQIGTMGCWKNQPLVLVHYGGGTASELIHFIQKIAEDVRKKTNIDIVPEVDIVYNE
jgi:UDP-N-acetylmuramate dehydrogenase